MAPTFGAEWGEASPIFMAADDIVKEKGAQDILSSAREKLEASKRANDKKGQATALIASAKGYLAMAAPEKALRTAADVLRLFRGINMPKGEAAALLMIADVQLGKGLADKALAAAQEALTVCQQKGDKQTEAAVLLTLASALAMLSRHSEALAEATRALALMDQLGNKEGKAGACMQLARTQLAMGNAKAATEKAQEAAALYKAAGGKAGEAAALRAVAEAHALQGSGTEALKASNDSIALLEGDAAGRAAGLLVAARAHQLKEDEEAGLKAAREALALFRQAGDDKGVALAQERCAELRKKPPFRAPPGTTKAPPLGVTKPMASCAPGVAGPAGLQPEPCTSVVRVVGSLDTKKLSGMVCCLTGGSRGIGKGISQMLAEAGAVVYVTGRSSPGKVTDILLMGTVDETAASFAKLGGIGVATHVDHAHDPQNKALADLIAQNHGRLDVLVNNAFYIPKPDLVFFSTPLFAQPIRFLNEQIAVGGFNHAAQTLLMLPSLRRGKGVVVNISSWGSQVNIPVFPAAYLCNKAAFDRSIATLSEQLRRYDVHCMTLWPGSVKSERSVMGAKRSGAKLVDLETTRFSGQAVVNLACLTSEELFHFSSAHRTVSSADIARFELDGYMHQGDIHTFSTGGRAILK